MMTSTQAVATRTKNSNGGSSSSSSSSGVVVAADHLELVRRVAKKIARRLPSVVDIDDLVGAGTVGLMDAAQRFDPVKSGSFPGYAEIRIRGAILDHLRAMDWLPRSLRTKNRRVDDAERKLKSSLGRAPEANELAEFLGTSLRSIKNAGNGAGAVVSVEDLREDGFDSFEMETPAPGSALESRERAQRLTAAVSRLPERSRQLLALYYVEELTLKQIGAMFGITESRACQLHGQAINKLRVELCDA